ncbi:plasmid SOS inhibition protein A [Erwinia tasmaniensis]|uniref:plasmid SOS inhibition protein A n=1 Tax=Erwinia tasmaniensis TaxID=338565 RepID=UPI0003089BBD|nr:plasmid SOS inhibition protein A [Erwinia tasmaniensis]
MHALNRTGAFTSARAKYARRCRSGKALDEFLYSAGEVCPLPLTGELATVLFPEAVFRRAERAKHAAQK